MITALHQNRILSFTTLMVISVVFGLTIGHFGLIGAAAVAAVIAGIIVIVRPDWLFYVGIGTIVIGQLVRLPLFGEDSGVLLNDIILPVLIIIWTRRRLASRTWIIPRASLWLPGGIFLAILVMSIVINRIAYSPSEMLSGLMYAVRWAEYAFLFIIAADLSLNKKIAWRLVMAMTWTGLALALLGFIQLKLFPDFTFMVPRGWDPHVGRMLSTWFDPNFLGGYLAALTTISFAIALSRGRRGYWWWAATIVMTLAVALTYSRSGYLALAAGLGIVALVKSRLMAWLGLLAVIATILFVPRVQERVIGIRTVDETAQMRLVSWDNALTVIQDHPVIGVGYNFYRYVQVQYGFLNKTTAHSASGSDSSLLTVAVTTGLIGLAVYLWLYLTFFREAILLAKSTSAGPDWSAYGLGLTAALVALLIHGQFVNGLLYPHIMQFIWISLGVAVAIKQNHHP